MYCADAAPLDPASAIKITAAALARWNIPPPPTRQTINPDPGIAQDQGAFKTAMAKIPKMLIT
jgi:hypothetical protein